MSPPRRWLWAALAVHFALAGYLAGLLPLWGAVPDEPLHYSRIKFEGEFGRLPEITDPRAFGEPLAVYCFTADPCGTSQHGPLYYWSGAVLFRLTRALTVTQQLYVLRAWSVALGALMVWLGWLILGRLFPDEPGLIVAGTFLITLLPHRLLMSAVVYNDIANGVAVFWYLWLLVRAAGDEGNERAWWWAGVGLGVALLVKRVALVTIPASLLLLWLQRRRLGWPAGRAVRCLGLWMLGALLVAGWWTARDVRLYGELLPAEPGHSRYTWLDLWYGVPHERFWWMIRYALRGLWLSVWGQVGWVPLSGPGTYGPGVARLLYGGFAVGTLGTLIGLLATLRRRPTPLERDFSLGWLALAAGMTYGALHWVMLASFHNNEETGKHAIAIFVGLVALAAVGWRTLVGRRGAVVALWLGVGFNAAFYLASVVNLKGYLIPTWAPPTPALASRRVGDLPSGAAPGIWHRYRVPGVSQEGGDVPPPGPPPATLRRR